MTAFPLTVKLDKVPETARANWSGNWESTLRSDFCPFVNDPASVGSMAYSHILELAGIGFALQCTCASPEHNREWVRYALWCINPLLPSVAKTPALFTAVTNMQSYVDGLIEPTNFTQNNFEAYLLAKEADPHGPMKNIVNESMSAAIGQAVAMTEEAGSPDSGLLLKYIAHHAAVAVVCDRAHKRFGDVQACPAVSEFCHAEWAVERITQAAGFRQLVTTGKLPQRHFT